MWQRLVIPFALAATLAGCSSGTAPVCPLHGVPAVAVKVRDASTGAFIAPGTTLELRLGGTVVAMQTLPDSLVDADEYLTAGEEPGTYDVVVRRAGYTVWQRTGIKVEDSGDCAHRPVTVRLEALLTPAT